MFRLAIDANVTHIYYLNNGHPCETCPFCLKRQRESGKTWFLPRLRMIVPLDGFHANQTSINLLKKFHFDFDIVLKRLKSVQAEIDPLILRNDLLQINALIT